MSLKTTYYLKRQLHMKIFNKVSIALVAILFTFGLAGLIKAATTVDLGTADDFAVLAGSGVVDTNPSAVTGDVGLSPTTGAAIGITAAEVTGTIYAVDAAGPAGSVEDPGLLTIAKNDLTDAYNDAAGQATDTSVTSDLGTFNGGTLTPGVYEDNDAPDSLALTGTLTLDAQGDPDAVFIFKSGSTLVTAADSEIILINGAQACNVFWQVGSSATLGTNSIFKGNILAAASITDNGGSIVEGRLLADANSDGTGAVTLNDTTVVKATCVTPPAVSSTSSGNIINPDDPQPPLISVTKIPTPLALPSGPGSVTYDYTVLNLGEVSMRNITVTDNQCDSVDFVSGDTDDDGRLDEDESWEYICTATLSETTTNTVTATGEANGFTAIDTANATVVVGVPLTPPLIHLVKRPNVFVLLGGGAVTYTYTVTNPGTEPLNNVSVIDDKCTGLPGRVLGHPGDLNENNLLESNETWTFTCQTNLTETTTNIGTAEGHANGLTAIDFSPATVVVTSAVLPGLPDAGAGGGSGGENSAPWNILIPAGIFLGLVSFYIARKKQIV
jgi:hypothetical protein